jgi:hypothetical protein
VEEFSENPIEDAFAFTKDLFLRRLRREYEDIQEKILAWSKTEDRIAESPADPRIHALLAERMELLERIDKLHGGGKTDDEIEESMKKMNEDFAAALQAGEEFDVSELEEIHRKDAELQAVTDDMTRRIDEIET